MKIWTRYLFFVSISLLLVALILSPEMAKSDQNDARLDDLFHQLKGLDQNNYDSAVIAHSIENNIWEIWVETTDPKINISMSRGTHAMQRSNFAEALAFFNDVVASAPNFAEGWNKRATVYYMMGQLDLSMLDVRSVLVLEPRHFGALSGMGLIFMQSGNYVRALQSFQKASKINPQMPNVQAYIKYLKEKIEQSAI
jgi:tetratricopeptide (TPR) repeat protein